MNGVTTNEQRERRDGKTRDEHETIITGYRSETLYEMPRNNLVCEKKPLFDFFFFFYTSVYGNLASFAN